MVEGSCEEDTLVAKFFDEVDEERIGKELTEDMNEKMLTVRNAY